MAKRDILEMQHRMKADTNNITWVAVCLVESDGTMGPIHKQRLAAMREEEYYKYLDKIKQVFAGKKYGDAVMQVTTDQTGITNTMAAAIKSEMKGDELIHEIIENTRDYITSERRYAIIIWQDIYDIVATNENNESLDESEEVLNYIGVMVCPVAMEQEGLAYNGETFEAKERRWVMTSPEFAYMWPSLVERRPDNDTVTLYFKEPGAPNHGFISNDLGCEEFRTRTEIQKNFEHAILISVDEPNQLSEMLGHINYKLRNLPEEDEVPADKMRAICRLAGIPDHITDKIWKNYAREFKKAPTVEELYVRKYANKYEAIAKVKEIKQTLNQAADLIENAVGNEDLTVDIRAVAAGL